MTEYALYLESGPQHRKTMVHVFDLLGCIANGPTTEAALAATPEAIRTYLRFLQRHGEPANPEASYTTTVAEHTTEGDWLGNGSPYAFFSPDLEPVSKAEAETLLRRFEALRDELASWAQARTDTELDATPAGGGRTARGVLLHVLAVPGAYLSTALSGVTGFSRIQTQAEHGEMGLAEALHRVAALAVERVHAATDEERRAVKQRPKEVRTLRKALRRTLEHDWEHLAELSRRPGGPSL